MELFTRTPGHITHCNIKPSQPGGGFSHVSVRIERDSGFKDLSPDTVEASFCYAIVDSTVRQVQITTLKYAIDMLKATLEKVEAGERGI
jgi:hypothetical protein